MKAYLGIVLPLLLYLRKIGLENQWLKKEFHVPRVLWGNEYGIWSCYKDFLTFIDAW